MRPGLQALRWPLAAVLIAWIWSAAAAAQKTVHGLGDTVAPSATTASPSAVLTIDGVEVSAQDYARFLLEEVGPPLVREFVQGWVVEREARVRGLAPSEAEVEAQLDEEIAVRIAGAFHGRHEEWLAELTRLGRSEPGHRLQRRTELRPRLAATALASEGRVVPEEKIVRDWELAWGPRGRSFDLDLLKVLVVVPAAEDAPPSPEILDRQIARARAQGRERALALRARLEAGERFEVLARAHSDDEATRARGGRIEPFTRRGWPDDFVEALFDLERGELSQPLFARGGWWLVRVRDWTDTPLASVRAELERKLIARGPEPDEVGAAWNAVVERTRFEVQPGMLAAQNPRAGEDPDPVALSVDGESVPRSQYARWLLSVRGEASWQAFAEAWLVERRARAQGIEVSAAQVEARVREALDEKVARSYQGDRDVWRAYLAASGRDEGLFLAQLARRQRLDLLVETLILAERVLDESAVEARFERLYGPLGRRVQARAILLEIPRPALEPGLTRPEVEARLAAGVEARRQDALALVGRLRDGEDFATLARRSSDEPMTRERGGELEGGFQPDAWPPAVARAVLELPRGVVSEPLLAGRWWALFEVVDFETVLFEDERPRLAEDLRTRRPTAPEIAGYRNRLLQAATIELLPGLRR